MLNIVRMVGYYSITSAIRIEVVTNNMHKVTGEEELCPEKATVMGAIQTIPVEYHNICCRSIDIVLPEPGSRGEIDLVNRLVEEFNSGSTDTPLAFRGRFRWVPKAKPVRLEKTGESPPSLLKEKGVYLITGGLGGIGLTLAEYLAESVRARLILTTRSAFPARGEWDNWLNTHGEIDGVSRKIRKVRELEQLGAEIIIFSADAADYRQMKAVIREAEETFAPINGIIHAAGLADYGGIIQRRSREITEKVLAPKVKGTLILHDIFKGIELDFFILFSSLSSFMDVFGQVGDVAANAFLDAYARSAVSGQGGRRLTVSINWDAWKDVGMATEAAERSGKTPVELRMGITPKEGVEVFKRILGFRLSQVAVSTLGLGTTTRKPGEAVEEEDELAGISPSDPQLDQRPELSTLYKAPQDEIGQTLARIWENFFGIKKVGIYDDFFELGGDSLKIITIISKIHKELDVEVSLPEFFKRPTIEKLAGYINSAKKSKYSCIPPVEKKEYYPLTMPLEKTFGPKKAYDYDTRLNMPTAFKIEGKIDRKRVEEAFKKLVNRHEALRTSFHFVNGTPVQKTHDRVDCKVHLTDCGEKEAGKRIKEFVRPFDLSRAPLLRVELLTVRDDKYFLLVDMHHNISDGVSIMILIKDFAALYEGKQPGPLKIQFKDYVFWLNDLLAGDAFEKFEKFWIHKMTDFTLTQLPPDKHNPSKVTECDSEILWVDGSLYKKIDEFCKKQNITKFSFFTAIFQIVLSWETGQKDITVGARISTRNHSQLKDIVGYLLNKVVIRSKIEYNNTFLNVLRRIHETVTEIMNNALYPYELLEHRIREENGITDEDLVTVIVNYLPPLEYKSEIPGFSSDIEVINVIESSSRYDIELNIQERSETIWVELIYKSNLYSSERIERLLNGFNNIISRVPEDAGIEINELHMPVYENRFINTSDTTDLIIDRKDKGVYYEQK